MSTSSTADHSSRARQKLGRPGASRSATGNPVYLHDVARGHRRPGGTRYLHHHRFRPRAPSTCSATGPAEARSVGERGTLYPAVTLAFAKRRGTNAVPWPRDSSARSKRSRVTRSRPSVNVLVTRNYGETANEKVNELVRELLIAVAIIVVLLAFSLGPREAFIVALAVPMTLAITLLGNLLVGYTINRVTLFALILSLGLLVDDPIVDVENIHRHFRLGTHPPREATLIAVDEVRPPTILATFTVIVSFLPMFFVTGMMGPYMRPMPFNVPLAMLVSLLVAFTVTPWAAYHLLRHEYAHATRRGEARRRGDDPALVHADSAVRCSTAGGARGSFCSAMVWRPRRARSCWWCSGWCR